MNGIAVGTRLFLNEGNGKFRESKVSSPFSMALADIDADGDLDL